MPKPHCMFIQAQDVPWEKGHCQTNWAGPEEPTIEDF